MASFQFGNTYYMLGRQSGKQFIRNLLMALHMSAYALTAPSLDYSFGRKIMEGIKDDWLH